MMKIPGVPAFLALLSCGAFCSLLAADTLYLVNGDSVQGNVVAVDAREITIRSAVLGELQIERSQVEAIYLGQRQRAARPENPPADRPGAPGDSPGSSRLGGLLQRLGRGENPRAVLDRLRKEGLAAGAVREAEQALPLLQQSPEVQAYVQKTLQGLLDGTIQLEDLRRQAVDARRTIRELQGELGPEAEVLSGYLGILDNFIRQSAPDANDDPPQPHPPRSEPSRSGNP
jgi:hypothetical protein